LSISNLKLQCWNVALLKECKRILYLRIVFPCSGDEKLSWNDFVSNTESEVASSRHVSVQLAEDTTPCIVHQYSVPEFSYPTSCTGEGGDNPLPVVVKEEHPTLTRHPDVDLFSRTDRKLRPDGVSGIWETRAPRLADLVTAVSFDLRSVVRTEAKRGNLKRNKTEADIDPVSYF